MIPDPIQKLIAALKRLPSIGPRQATRLAFYLARDKTLVPDFLEALADIKTMSLCQQCFWTHKNADGLCDICRDAKRRPHVVAIVEKETDLLSLEKTKKFNGRYLILGELSRGLIDANQRGRLNSLKNRLSQLPNDPTKEIILAVSPTTYGDLAATLISRELEGVAQKITRLGRGLPTGGEIEFADEETLGQALDNRS